MHRVALAAAVFVLAGCDSQQQLTSDGDFQVVRTSDAFEGTQIVAQAIFANDEGIQAQVQLTCGTTKPSPGALAQMFVPTRNSCPDGHICSAKMRVGSFDAVGNGAPLVRAFQEDLFGYGQVTPVMMKNTRSGAVAEFQALLDKDGDQFYSNQVSIPVPTSTSVTSLIYRFKIQGHMPMDVPLDFSKPRLAAFINSCNASVMNAERQKKEEAAREALLAEQNSLITAARLHPTAVPSFNCSTQFTLNRAEAHICLDEKLASLDRQLAAIFDAALANAGEQEMVREEQQEWLRSVRNACNDSDCLARAYTSRITVLQESFSPEDLNDNPTSEEGDESFQ